MGNAKGRKSRAHGAGSDVVCAACKSRRLRVALYSPGMVGIGHMRRNLLIAQTLAAPDVNATVLMIAEAREANVLSLPPGGDCLTLPALRKEYDGDCGPRYLDVSLEVLWTVRSRAIGAALNAFDPHVLIVDHLPRGALGELDACLEELRAAGRTRCVLGLRDVLEDPAVVRRDWVAADHDSAIHDYYDAIWIYGDPAVYDPVREYGFAPAVAAKVHYTGYLDPRSRPQGEDPPCPDVRAALPGAAERLMLCTVGGGQDGAVLAEAFAQTELPRDAVGVLLMGPFMPPDVQRRLRRHAADNPRLRVLGFVSNPDALLNRADRVIAMGGYNTVYEVLAFEKHALVVPRSKPRHEQQIRAERLRSLGLLELLPLGDVTPAALARWLERDLGPPPPVRQRINLDGTRRLPRLLEEVIRTSSRPDWREAPTHDIQTARH